MGHFFKKRYSQYKIGHLREPFEKFYFYHFIRIEIRCVELCFFFTVDLLRLGQRGYIGSQIIQIMV